MDSSSWKLPVSWSVAQTEYASEVTCRLMPAAFSSGCRICRMLR